MFDNLDARLIRWLDTGGTSLEVVIAEEAHNRLDYYPAIQSALQTRPVDLRGLATRASKCWVLDRWKQMRFTAFVQKGDFAREVIAWLLDDLPEHPADAAHHIDEFIEHAVSAGFQHPDGKPDRPGALTLASLLLTAAYPAQFVDYPSTKKWKQFLTRFGCEMPDLDSYGARLVWVSDFAATWAKQPPFRLLATLHEPLWVISGLCWASDRYRSSD
ncbi:MAG: hypothetical protein GX613_00485 [Chloroflexi bacterium]|nr:hypothetical protein [Chloroflexota bacterium]